MFNPNSSKLPNEWLDDWHHSSVAFSLIAKWTQASWRRGKQRKKWKESVRVKGKSPEKSPNAIVPGSKSHPFLRSEQQRGFRALWTSKHRIGKTNTFRRWIRQRRKHRDFAVCVESPIYDAPVSSPATHTHSSLLLWRTSAHTHREGGKRKGGVKRANLLFLNLCLSLSQDVQCCWRER